MSGMIRNGMEDRYHIVRRGALAGIAGPLIFAAVVVILTVAEYDFLRGLGWHPTRRNEVAWPSSTALGPYGWVQVANFVIFGLLMVVFAAGLWRAAKARGWSRVGPALVFVAGIAWLILGFFKTDRPGAEISFSGIMHGVGFMLLILSMTLAFFTFAWTWRRDPYWRGLRWYSLASGVLLIAVLFILSAFLGQLTDYLFLLLVLAWPVVVGARLRSTSSAPGGAMA
ncbi:MAG: DUF998 domain-containing protein [Rubrobacter sp.]|nr:DUF998 domain-containing protein [Rubrobacter sp.]